ncbi:MAG: 16S rRNA (guanine(966)-N(2))-methyltransferase RsmD [Bacilli bacterium]|nr:16S rRNA (guanine(966)-N(2))-methyltransferase RsmD [Bacilli bacterium]
MKVISGKYKGRKLLGFNIDGTRPTMDRVKESLFAMIQDYLAEATILDLFCGSGALGIEALSQNSKYAYFIDKNPKAINIVKKNIETLDITNAEVIRNDYLKFLESTTNTFDVIFLDPPYKTDFISKTLNIIEKRNLLNDKGIIVCETDQLNKVNNNNFTSIKEKKYGDKYIVILKKIV